MTWHLKDRELEKKLNELVGGNQFTEALNRECSCINYQKIIVVKFGENTGHVKGSFRCYFEKDELTNIGYDPHDWNDYPDVKPPENVWMRVETNMGFGFKTRFEHGDWLDNRNDVVGFDDGNVIRYRPWED